MGLLQEWREYAYGVELNSKEGKAIWDKYFEQESHLSAVTCGSGGSGIRYCSGISR